MLIVYRPLESLSLQKSPETKNMIEKVLKKKKKLPKSQTTNQNQDISNSKQSKPTSKSMYL